MFNSGVGIFEIVVIAVVALMVLGPEKFPGFAKVSVRTFRDIKKYMTEAQREIATELNPLKKELDTLKKVDVESYVEKLIGDDTDSSDSDGDEDEEEIEGDYNGEPEMDVTQDWYPEDQNELMPGADETAEVESTEELISETEEAEQNSELEYAGETVPYEEPAIAPNVESAVEDSDSMLPDRDDDFDMAGGFDSREEVVDAENPERLDS